MLLEKVNIGICLGHRASFIVKIGREQHEEVPYGGLDGVDDDEYKAFYERLMLAIQDADYLFIIGPAPFVVELQRHIESDKTFTPLVAGVETSNGLSKKQAIAKIKNFFSAYLRVFSTNMDDIDN